MFVCQRPAANGNGWFAGLHGIAKPLYRLPEVVRATYVCICEGEKDCDRLASLNMAQYDADGQPVAVTTNFDGAGKWRPEYGPHFIDKQVVIFPDNDKVGAEHALDCARGIKGSRERSDSIQAS
jgi:hypothetical protein